jgi:hypothetical protein
MSGASPPRRDLTPEQRAYRERMDRRNRAIQEAAIKPPPSGTFGKGVPPEAKGKGKGKRGR